MQRNEPRDDKDGNQQRRGTNRPRRVLNAPFVAAAVIAGFVLWAHLGSGVQAFHSRVSFAPGWDEFRASYRVEEFGVDGYFSRAIQNGYNLFFHTHQYGQRFTRKTNRDAVNSCSGCHTAEGLAYAF